MDKTILKDNSSDLDEVDLARQVNKELDTNEKNEYKYSRAEVELRNISLTETDVHMVGDGIVIAQIVQLLSYIRHAIKNNFNGEITLQFGQELANAEFNLDVNGCEIPDLIPPDKVQLT